MKFRRKMPSKLKQPAEVEPPDGSSVVTKRHEEKKVQERVAIGPHIVYETIRREGEAELRRSSSSLAWSGLAAGMSMGFSLIAEGLLAGHLPDRPWTPLLSKLGYSVGFLIVVLGRQQLYTETTLTVILPLLSRKNLKTALSVLRLWSVVLFANLAGTFLFALCVGRIPILPPQIQQSLIQVSHGATDGSFGVIFMRAIFAGWLIALMVWLLPAAESARVSIIIIITYLIGLGGFNHVVAGSTKSLLLVVAGMETWTSFLVRFFFPTLLGNIVGGVSLVAFLGHAQVVAGADIE